jgi:hypothetical protein
MNEPLANYEVPRAAFEDLLRKGCVRRILLVRGESGSGKTALLNHCRLTIPEGEFDVVGVQLRGSVVSVAEIFSRAGRALGWQRLPHFARQHAALGGMQIEGNSQEGINNSINVVLHASDNKDDRDQRRTALTDAWFNDFAALRRPVLMLFDTFEQAPTEVQAWLEGPFLTRTVQTPSLRVLIAGQTVPDRNNIEWGHCCVHQDLPGVPEAPHWLPVLRVMGRLVPSNRNPEDWLAGVCAAFKGRPEAIMKIIEGLPREEGAA